MKLVWLQYDDTMDENFHGEITNLMRVFLYIIPAIAVTLATVNFIFGHTNIALATLTVPAFCWIAMFFLNHGHVNASMIIITSIMMIVTTIICFFGRGIHEVGIIIFPVIVFFSSLVMNMRGVIVTTTLVVVCLALVVIEEQFNFLPGNEPVANWVNLIVALAVLVFHTFMTFNFSSITKNNLKLIRDELGNQKKYKIEIGEQLEEKTELLRLVHHRVKNNLLLINSLIELEAYEKPEIKGEFKEFSDSIHTIARAHDPLYHSKDYKQVSIKPYLEKLLTAFIQSNNIKKLDILINDYLVFHEKALLLGILLQKLLRKIESLESHELMVALTQAEQTYQLEITSKNRSIELADDSTLIESLNKKINGTLKIKGMKVSLSFPS